MQSATHLTSPLSATLSVIAAPFKALFAGLVRLAENNAMLRRAEYLFSLSDAELAARGLNRDDIIRHVYPHAL